LTSTATAATAAPTVRKRQRSATQIQRNELIRLQLLEAAGKVIGKYGYAGCTIARVTAKTKIAHGTFYLHFGSRQDLFDALLPALGTRMLQVIADAIHDPKDIIDLERRGFQANFDYLSKNSYMYRLLSEAELFAPKAFKSHMERMTSAYARSLRRSKFGHQLDDFEDDELETIATMLIGARTYLLMRYGVVNNVVKPLPPAKLGSYLKFIAHGITGHLNDARGRTPKAANS
jgi:AcrR family transcriptional regulator